MESEFFAVLTKDNKLVPHMRNEVQNLITFLQDIDWTEPWLIGLLVFHAAVTTLTIVTRHHGNFQGIFFFLLLLLVYCSSTINELAASNWKTYALLDIEVKEGTGTSCIMFSKGIQQLSLGVGHINVLEGPQRYFSRQQYFDSRGMFISIVFSSPILLNCLIMVGQWLWISGSLMVKVKQAQLRQELKAEKLKKQRKESVNHDKKE